ncbi:11884_t:CDS:2 [Diversispora eburnea]|uniref:11884_t:CDS:1 n=1 Tax=Diversispora eburnea TaxID=1213867 RepID=A0A9N8W598_9GLOM|nr:11884_t:CDS:2 [Diversispora eburnea]
MGCLKSALAGNINAVNIIGYGYDKGIGVGVDRKEAFKWYFEGSSETFKWYEKSAENECVYGQYMHGEYIYEGRGTCKDIIKAICY